jgi:hypothetical protein
MKRFLLGVLVVAGCGGDRPSPGAQGSSDTIAVDSGMAIVARAANVTLAAREFPASTDSILTASGLTIEEFEALLYRIAADSALAALYRDAVGGRR